MESYFLTLGNGKFDVLFVSQERRNGKHFKFVRKLTRGRKFCR